MIEQFQGYFELEDIDLSAFEPRSAPIDVLLGRDRIQRSKIIKQADVVMLLHLLWDDYPPGVREVNFRYYEPRCAHGSSLSPSIHALIAARLGDYRSRCATSGRQWTSISPTIWGMQRGAFMRLHLAAYGRPLSSVSRGFA